MKKSFTLIELIIVIVILGILSSITFDVLTKVYKNYLYKKEMNKLNSKVSITLEMISARLRDRIRNSVIVTKYPANFTDNNPAKVDFKSIAEIQDNDTKYKILEWINKDYEAKNGMWDKRVQHIQTGWSGFIDLDLQQPNHKTNENPKEFNVTTIDSNFTMVKMIDYNITHYLGEDSDPFESNTTTLIFSGIDLGGDIVDDINHSYGWYLLDPNRQAKAVFAIESYHEYLGPNNTPRDDLNITSITKNDNTNKLYSRYFLARSAYALVPIENNETLEDGTQINDYNLTFVYNYQPWQGEWFKDGNKTLLATHVTEIRFKKDLDTPMVRIYLCIQSPSIIIDNNGTHLNVCKEKAMF
jgi:prepilin-type N-terminal cleavage/methylation domain-containing protein